MPALSCSSRHAHQLLAGSALCAAFYGDSLHCGIMHAAILVLHRELRAMRQYDTYRERSSATWGIV